MIDDLREGLGALTQAAHPSLGPAVSSVLASGRRPRPVRRQRGRLAAAALLLLVAGALANFIGLRPGRPTPVSIIPAPVPQAITRTSPGAQVAWIETANGLLGYDPGGHLVADLPAVTANNPYGSWRSADGATIYSDTGSELVAYRAVDGRLIRAYQHLSGGIVGDAFSPDGHTMALLTAAADHYRLQLLDLASGMAPTASIPRDPNAQRSGMSGGGAAWALPVFAPDSSAVYVLTDWGGPLRVSTFVLTQEGTINGRTSTVAGSPATTCDGPAVASQVTRASGVPTLVAFCHSSGEVIFVDLTSYAGRVVSSGQPNPFWYSPIFTPDGRRLYLHSVGSGRSDTLTMVDLSTGKVHGPVITPQDLSLPGPFAAFVTEAHAGGVASTVPISPDGLTLYSATPNGVISLRIPDLKPRARLGPGINCQEVWVSGDGGTLFVTADAGQRIAVIRSDGSAVKVIATPHGSYGFLASEHG